MRRAWQTSNKRWRQPRAFAPDGIARPDSATRRLRCCRICEISPPPPDSQVSAASPGGLLHRIERLIGPARRRINTPDCVIAERGTDYVLCTDERETWCAVASGQVELAGIAPVAKPVIVNPMQRAALKAGQVDWQIETLTADDYERLVSSCDPLVN
jgi:hypothetical protein